LGETQDGQRKLETSSGKPETHIRKPDNYKNAKKGTESLTLAGGNLRQARKNLRQTA